MVDENDSPLFMTTLDECKRRGLLHRSVTVFLRDSGRKILLQRRSFTDDWLPGKWTLSSTGHIRADENPRAAASRELQEELGVVADLAFVFKELLPPITWEDKIEYELTFAFEAVSDDSIRMNPAEIEGVRFLSYDECSRLIINRPEDLTPDAIVLLQKYLSSLLGP